MDGWWQRALNRMAERDEDWQARFDALPLCFFHYRASSGAWLMGAMSPSQDASGRRYPLLVFQRLAARRWWRAVSGCIPSARPSPGRCGSCCAM
ncbi:type VI secretion system-associated protein TagF [Cobetia marina]